MRRHAPRRQAPQRRGRHQGRHIVKGGKRPLMRHLGHRGLAISLGEQQKRHPRAHRGLGIDLAVAHKHRRPRAQRRQSRVQRSRIGLSHRQAVAAHNGLKIPRKSEMRQDALCRPQRLVGADPQAVPRGLQRLQGRHDPRIDHGQIHRVLIAFKKRRQEPRLRGVGDPPGRPHPRHEHRRAVADEPACRVQRHRRGALCRQDAVGQRVDVRRAVDQGAIQIENDPRHLRPPST